MLFVAVLWPFFVAEFRVVCRIAVQHIVIHLRHLFRQSSEDTGSAYSEPLYKCTDHGGHEA